MTARAYEHEIQGGFPSSSFRKTPLMHVRVVLVKFTQGLFAACPYGAFHWSDDDEQTEIAITAENQISADVVKRVPAVTFTRGPIQFYSVGLDDMEQYSFSTGKKTKGVLLPGTMTANCVSTNDLESEHIAFVLADHIWLMRDLLMRAGFFDIGKNIQVGSPSPAGSLIKNDQGLEAYVTPISIPFQLTRMGSRTPLGQEIVRSIELSVGKYVNNKQYSQGIPDPGVDGPYSIELPPPPNVAAPASREFTNAGGVDGALVGRDVASPLPRMASPLNPGVSPRVRVVYRQANQPGAGVPLEGDGVGASGSTTSAPR